MMPEDLKPLPVKGYTDQSNEKVDLVNRFKEMEERLLREIDALTARGNALNASAVALDIVGGVALTAGASWTIADWLKRGRADRRLPLTPGWPMQRAGRTGIDRPM